MTTRLIITSFVLAASMLAVEPADKVRETSAAWRQAVIQKDESTLQRVLADDLTYSHANGKTQNKTEYIAAIVKTGRYESFTEADTQVRVYGGTAVLTGYVDVKIAGRDSYRVRTLEVYVLNKGQWQMAAKQSARLSP